MSRGHSHQCDLIVVTQTLFDKGKQLRRAHASIGMGYLLRGSVESEIGGRSRPHRGCSARQTAYHRAVRWNKRKRVIEPGTSAAWRSFSETASPKRTGCAARQRCF